MPTEACPVPSIMSSLKLGDWTHSSPLSWLGHPRSLSPGGCWDRMLCLPASHDKTWPKPPLRGLIQKALAGLNGAIVTAPLPLQWGRGLWGEGKPCFMACFANVRITGFPGVNGGDGAESPA